MKSLHFWQPPLGGPNLSDWSLPFDQDRQDRRKVSNSDPDRTDSSAKVPRALSEIKKPHRFSEPRGTPLGRTGMRQPVHQG